MVPLRLSPLRLHLCYEGHEFGLKLIPGAEPISKAPYRMDTELNRKSYKSSYRDVGEWLYRPSVTPCFPFHIVSARRHPFMDPSKVEAIRRAMARPTTVTKGEKFSGLLDYYRHFVEAVGIPVVEIGMRFPWISLLNPKFTSRFGNGLQKAWEHVLSSVQHIHPQTDGQSKGPFRLWKICWRLVLEWTVVVGDVKFCLIATEEYADNIDMTREYQVGDRVLSEVSPFREVINFGIKGKASSPRFNGI
ncbi:hypothetical protein Tco_0097902 [Tanacetum coccineum]